MTDPGAVTAAVARNLRELRAARGWSLDALAGRSGVSRGMLIAIEQGRSNPSIATLCRISDAFGVALVRLVETTRQPLVRVVPPEETIPLWQGRPGSVATLLVSSDLPQHVELWEWRIAGGDSYDGEPHPGGTREIVWVLEGELTLRVAGDVVTVPTGGAAAFPGDRPHRYTNDGTTALRLAMAVSQPPTDPGA